MDKTEVLARIARIEEAARRVWADIGSLKSDIDKFLKENENKTG